MSDALDKLKEEQAQSAIKLDREVSALAMIEHLHKELTSLGFEPVLEVVDGPRQPINLNVRLQWSGENCAPEVEEKCEPVADTEPEVPAPVSVEKQTVGWQAWSNKDVAKIETALEAGWEIAEIHEMFPSRTRKAVIVRVSRVREATRSKAVSAGAKPPVERIDLRKKNTPTPPAPPPASDPVPPAAPPVAVSESREIGGGQDCTTGATDVPLAERRVETMLNALGYVAPWDAGLDLEMVDLLVSGSSAAQAAQILEIKKNHLVDRWKRLLPEPTIENQQTLLTVLRRRAKQKEAS